MFSFSRTDFFSRTRPDSETFPNSDHGHYESHYIDMIVRTSTFAYRQTFAPSRLPSALFATSLSEVSNDLSVASSTTFEPIAPPTETLVGFGVIFVLCVIASWVWQNQVVPVSRTKLAISKSRGQVKEYLDELKASENATPLNDVTATTSMAFEGVSENVSQDDRAFERWLFTDWLQDNKSARKAGRQKEPALPILKDAKWNSGDNPVLVAAALLGICILFSAITERIVSL